MSLDGGEKLESTLGCLLDFLFVSQTATILDRNQITHFFVKLRIDSHYSKIRYVILFIKFKATITSVLSD